MLLPRGRPSSVFGPMIGVLVVSGACYPVPEYHAAVRFGPDLEEAATLEAPNGFEPIVGDFDGDGRDDVANSSRLELLVMLAPGFESEELPIAEAESREAVAGDIDGDGSEELVVLSDGLLELWSLEAAGWTVLDSKAVTGVESPPALGDFDGDGTLDIATARMSSESLALVRTFHADESGRLTASPHQHSIPNYNAFLAPAQDFDGDGYDDIRLGDHWVFNDDDGGTIVDVGVFGRYGIDVDGDGDLDLVTVRDRFEVSENIYGRSFSAPHDAGIAPENTSSLFTLVTLDGGRPGVMLRHMFHEDTFIMHPDDDGTFVMTREIRLPDEGQTESVSPGDFDGDGATDFLHVWSTR